MWSGHPLGQPITGRAASVSSMRRSTVIDYIGDFYQAPNMVVAAAGLVPHRVLVELTKKHFRRTSKLPARNDSHPQEPGFSIKAVKNHTKQTHVCIGFPSLDFADRQRYALLAINALLSGGMSSRLFQSVREKAGYCYNIYSYQEFFHDTGMFCVYFSADGKYVVRASRLVLTELRRLREKLLGRSEVAELKNQLKGGLMLSQESMYNRMNRIARQELMTQSYLSLSEACRHIDAVTPREIRDTANRVFDSARLTCCSLGGTRRQELDGVRWSIL
jgi:predicted Zn-dependent peptidase